MIFGLNLLELLIGAIFGAVPVIWIHWWALITVPLCAFLWAWTGAGHGVIWRKVLMPAITVGAICVTRHSWHPAIGLPFMMLVLSLGYGIPSTRPPDPGSMLGRFWWSKTDGITEKEHQDHAEFLTRFTIYIALGLCFIPSFF